MPIVKPDFSEIGMGGGKTEREPVPSGEYVVQIIGVEQKTGQQSGLPYLNWKLEIQSEEKRFDKRWLYHATPLSGKGAGILKSFIQAATQTIYQGDEFDPEDLIGMELRVDVEEQPGKAFSKVTKAKSLFGDEEQAS